MKNLMESMCEMPFRAEVPFPHVEVFLKEYEKLTTSLSSLTSDFKLDPKSFFCAVHNAKKDYVNFVFIEKEGKFHMMLHLSDELQEMEPGDKLYYLPQGNAMRLTVESDWTKYKAEKDAYKEELGKNIKDLTGICNTQIISYKSREIYHFYLTHYNILDHLKLEFSMMQIVEMDVDDEDLKEYYKNNDKRIFFAARLIGNDDVSGYFNFGYRIP